MPLTDGKACLGKKVLVKEKLKEPRTGRVAIGTATVVVKGISPSRDRVLLEYPKRASMSRWSEAKNLKIVRELDDEKDGGEAPIPAQMSEKLTVEPEAIREFVPRLSKGVGAVPVEGADIPWQLELFCTDYITALGEALDIAIRIGHKEYEAGFKEATDALSNGWLGVPGRNPFQLGVLKEDRPQMLAEIKLLAELGGIPYNKLSPLNQFIVTIQPNVSSCGNDVYLEL